MRITSSWAEQTKGRFASFTSLMETKFKYIKFWLIWGIEKPTPSLCVTNVFTKACFTINVIIKWTDFTYLELSTRSLDFPLPSFCETTRGKMLFK